MATELAVGYVSILPSTQKFAPTLRRELATTGDVAGRESGKKFAAGFGASTKGIAKTFAATFAVAAAGGFLKSAITEASDLNESVNAVRVTYGKAAKDILALSENAAQGYGLSSREFNAMSVQLAGFSKRIAGSTKDAPKAFDAIIGRARDFASVMNLDVAEAARLFQSGLAGETEPLRRFDVDLSAAAVEAYALSSGLIDNKKQLTEGMKVQARYGLLMESTEHTAGDFAATQDSLANVSRSLKGEWTDLKAQAGDKLLPVLESLLGAANDIIPKIDDFGDKVKDAADFVDDNKVAIGFLIGALVAYKGVAMTTTVAEQALALWRARGAVATGLATAAQLKLNMAMRANPIGLVITLLAALASGLVYAYQNSETFRAIVDGAWAGIKYAAGAAWAYIKTRLDNFREGIGKVADAFTATKQKIGEIWLGLVSVVQNPITTAIRLINGFIGLVNRIPGIEIPLIPIGAGGVTAVKRYADDRRQQFATGGAVRGPGTGTSDSIMARLSNGEHVLTAQDVRNMGGHARVYAMRAAARMGQFHLPGYATGGRVFPVRGSRRWGAGYPGHTGVDFARPTGTPVYAAHTGRVNSTPKLLNSYGWHIRQSGMGGESIYAHLSRIMVQAGQMAYAGQQIGQVGSTGNSTGPHLHFERRPPGTQAGTGAWLNGAGTASGKGPSIWDRAKSFFSDTVSGLTSWFRDKIQSSLLDKANVGGLFGDMSGLLSEIGSSVRGWVKDKVFDSGGIARGKGAMVKNTIQPERVLSPRETRAFEAMRADGFGGGTRTVELGQQTIDRLAAEILAGAGMVSVAAIANDARVRNAGRVTPGVNR